MQTSRARLALASSLLLTTALAVAGPAAGADPGDPAYTARDAQNMADAYGRVTEGQLQNPAYLPALVQANTAKGVDQLLTQVAAPNRPAITPGNFFPGWNVGNPLRAGWGGTRGLEIRGRVHQPLRRATARHVYAPLPAPATRTRASAARPLPGRGHHDGLDPGLGEDVPLAGRGPRRARLRCAHLRRAGPGHERDVPAPGAPAEHLPPATRPPQPAPASSRLPRRPRRSSRRTSSIGTRDALRFFALHAEAAATRTAAGDGATSTRSTRYWGLIDRRRTATR